MSRRRSGSYCNRVVDLMLGRDDGQFLVPQTVLDDRRPVEGRLDIKAGSTSYRDVVWWKSGAGDELSDVSRVSVKVSSSKNYKEIPYGKIAMEAFLRDAVVES